ncbi:MAG: DUF4851 domain-containing protein [Desulfovibrio sp.]|jgi:hypothetical protein|nr:DUF4851 domain-containing protein [Desulfovibrio sp.]
MLPSPALKGCCLGLLALLLLGGCTPARRIAADHGLYSSGNPPFSFTFDPALKLAGAGRMQADVPSDTNIRPSAFIHYAVFAEDSSGPVLRHAHALIAALPQGLWRWELESWPQPASLSLTKKEEEGKFWTVQMLPVAALGDWFSAFWTGNGREVPRFWLLKRWSSTPLDETRILAEYREPAPLCMEEALLPLEGIARREQVSPPDGAALSLLCHKEIRAFSARADAAVSLKSISPPEPGVPPAFIRPATAPNMKKLAGVAELLPSIGLDLSSEP